MHPFVYLLAAVASVTAASINPGTYRIVNNNATTSSLAARAKHPSIVVPDTEDIQSNVWLVIPAAAQDTFIFTNQFTNTSALTEYCEDSPVIAASPRDATAFEIIEAQVPGVYSIKYAGATPALVWTAVRSRAAPTELEVQLRSDKGEVNQQWILEPVGV